jgi:ribosome recycling factor
VVKHMAEEGRVAVRNLRRSARHDLEALEREGDVSADDVDRAAKELDRITASAVADIDSALEHKERELLEG